MDYMYREQNRFTLPVKQVMSDLKTMGSEYVLKKYRISASQLSKIKMISDNELIKEQESLQARIFELKQQDYNSVEIARELSIPLEVVNDLWNPFVFRPR